MVAESAKLEAWLDHIVLNVRDVDRALVFYVDVIGLQGERVEQFRSGEVIFPSVRINSDTLIDLAGPDLWAHEEGDGKPTNLNHFCICVTAAQWEALAARLAAAGVEMEAGPMTLWGAHGDATAYYLRDPDGNMLELRYYR